MTIDRRRPWTEAEEGRAGKTHGPGMKIMNVLGFSLVPLALGQVSNPSAQECSVDNL